MTFIADLHIHSKWSRATSKQCDLEHLAWWGRRKGIDVVATGDFTHPAWFAELEQKLVPAEPGLFRLRDDLAAEVDRTLPGSAPGDTRFLLAVEISSIYKRHDQVRKVHNVVYAPDLERARGIVERLDRIGNLAADGRPILGLDSHDLLEIVLEVGGGSFLIPAHIWTPWFSLFGAKSGFDTIEDCFGDLTPHIFALETGLSSDPAMNWQISALDRYRLVSNSDAHSPQKLGREANLFDTSLDYFEIKRALETGAGFAGTVEFFPEEGKYHLDGHRKCNVRLTPEETRALDGRCPACGKPVTVGVSNRVAQLADRPAGHRPEGAAPFRSLIPLNEIIGETLSVGPKSKRVAKAYDKLLDRVGPELFVLERADLDAVRAHGGELVAEALRRMRAREVICEAGFDGEYGVVRLFRRGEIQGKTGTLFALPDAPTPAPKSSAAAANVHYTAPARATATAAAAPTPYTATATESAAAAGSAPYTAAGSAPDTAPALDPDQAAAAAIIEGPLLIIAGPGTGKTRTLTHRLAQLVEHHRVEPSACLALTFTRRAAGEMRDRLADLLSERAAAITVTTFHGLAHQILREHHAACGLPPDFTILLPNDARAGLAAALGVSPTRAGKLLSAISLAKRGGDKPKPGSDLAAAITAYHRLLAEQGQVDFDDLILSTVTLLDTNPDITHQLRARYRFVSIDEYQDIDAFQYRLVHLLVPPDGNVCAIGDPDQAIYAFRGADVRFFLRFTEDFRGARVVRLSRNYRSSATIVDASLQVVAPASLVEDRRLEATLLDRTPITIHSAATDRAEAELVAHRIEQAIGGYGFFSVDSGRVGEGDAGDLGFSDVAVLFRTSAQLPLLEEALGRAGIPYQAVGHARLSELPGVDQLLMAWRATPPAGTVVEQLEAVAADLTGDIPPDTIAALGPLAQRCGSDRAEFLSELALGSETDRWDPRADRVSLMTLHAAKGLEFDLVFVVGCEDGLLPLHWPGSEPDLAEERRLFFVGMTRARRCLVLSHASKRQLRGEVRPREPSPFLREIEERLVERSQTRAGGGRRAKDQQLEMF